MANGLYSNEELIDSLIVDCNEAVKSVSSGQMIQWCKIMYEMVVKLANLKNGIKSDMQNREETIKTLKQQLRDAGMQVEDIELEGLKDAGVSENSNPCG